MIEVISLISVWNGIHFRIEEKKPDDEDVVRSLSSQFVEIYAANSKVFPMIVFTPSFKLKVGPLIWTILLKESVHLEGELVYGLTHHLLKEVHISKNQIGFEQIKTFWHELFHVILFSSGCLMRFYDPARYPSELDIVTTLGLWITMIINDNPEVFPCPTLKP
jgi:hypothetical protein